GIINGCNRKPPIGSRNVPSPENTMVAPIKNNQAPENVGEFAGLEPLACRPAVAADSHWGPKCMA
ncbi:MAG TPA: hypothetical protein VG056_03735, partial [Pirellulales bacterium]|nr:hypothetical protein [Pirellulales bacterium]